MALVITKKQRRTILGLMTAGLIVIAVAVATLGGDSTETEAAAGLPDTPFELFDGGQATFEDFSGRPLVINFWASWCPACVAELPEFQAAHVEFGDEVTFLGIANADRRAPALDLAEQVGLTYELGDDPNGEVFRELGLIAMPSTIFVTADGEVLEVFGGQLTGQALADRINELIEAS